MNTLSAWTIISYVLFSVYHTVSDQVITIESCDQSSVQSFAGNGVSANQIPSLHKHGVHLMGCI